MKKYLNGEEKACRADILKRVKKYYGFYHKKEDFVAGKSKIHYAGRVYDHNEMVNLVDSSLDLWLTADRYAEKFEQKLAAFIGVKHASFVNSGSSANLLAISALTSPLLNRKRLKAGDEVITTALNFPTTVAPVIQNNLIPVFVDIDLGGYNADIGALKKAVSKKTKAIFLAHTMGNPFNIREVRNICNKYGIWLIEDNCDALGSEYNDARTGSFGDISTLSFYPAHHITTGEGGAVLTNDSILNKIINSLRDWGRDCWCKPGIDNTCGGRFSGQSGSLPAGYDHKYVYSHLGYNLKATDMQAAVGTAQMGKLRYFVKSRRENHEHLYNRLADLKNKILLPIAQKDSKPSWFGFVMTLKDEYSIKRNKVITSLEKADIQTRLVFAGNITRQPCFAHLRAGRHYRVAGSLSNTDKVMRDGFWVGVYPGIDKKMIVYIADEIRRALR